MHCSKNEDTNRQRRASDPSSDSGTRGPGGGRGAAVLRGEGPEFFFHRIRVKFTLLPDKGREAARDFTR